MHGPIAAGVALEASVDADGVTHLGTHIVDAGSVAKVKAGVLKGFSMGGSITRRNKINKKIIDGVKITEFSLVDRPANPDSVITLVKLDKNGALIEKVAARSDVDPDAGKEKYGDVEFADAKNKKYPIDTAAHVRAAWNYINKPDNAGKYSAKDVATIKRKIIAAWKDKIDADGPPSATEKADMAGTLKKDMGDVSQLASLLQSIYYLQCSVECETEWEGDESTTPEDIKAWCAQGCKILRGMVSEETAELLGLDNEGDDMLETAAKKIADGDLAKADKSATGNDLLIKAATALQESAAALIDAMKDGAPAKKDEPVAKTEKSITTDREAQFMEALEKANKAAETSAELANRALAISEQALAKGNLHVISKGDDSTTPAKIDPNDPDGFRKAMAETRKNPLQFKRLAQ